MPSVPHTVFYRLIHKDGYPLFFERNNKWNDPNKHFVKIVKYDTGVPAVFDDFEAAKRVLSVNDVSLMWGEFVGSDFIIEKVEKTRVYP